ncbi:hypothetical protein [Paraburkholderia fungorum]|nr:hypothetical protein [Paraburkholderia fungorum]
MEVSTQYTYASTPAISLGPFAEQSSSAKAPSVQTKMFPEHRFANRSSIATPDQSAITHRSATGSSQTGAGKVDAKADQTLSREKRGAVLGACAKSDFRECRGGSALEGNASSHVLFDQFDRKETRGDEGRGTCEGIAREAIRRIDRAYGTTTQGLSSAVSSMVTDMDGKTAARDDTYGRIERYQHNPGTLGLSNYRQSSILNLNPDGTSSRVDRINGLIDSTSDIPLGGLAYIRVGIQSADQMGPETSGHVLLVQHLPRDTQGDGYASPDRYQVFDPNNGVFTYDSLDQMQTSLRSYMDSAYNEDGDIAAPNIVLNFVPASSRDYGSLPPTTTVPAPPINQLEPPELLQHFGHFAAGGSGM